MELSIGHWLLITVVIGCGVWVYRTLWRLVKHLHLKVVSPCLGKAVLVKRDEADKEVEGEVEVEGEFETCPYCTEDDREVESC